MKKTRIALTALAFVTVLTSCSKNDNNPYTEPPVNATVFTAAGDSTAIAAKLADFRNQLGATLNTAPGATGGRREINWDAVPPSFTNNNNFPHNFFNNPDPVLANGRKRGFVIENTAVPFRVDSTGFADIASTYATQFRNFSPKRLFMSMGGNETIGIFQVPGATTPAFVKGFGVIFCDVDNDNSASIEFFNGTKSLGVFKAPKATQSSFGFTLLGVYFPDEKITKVKITSGQNTLGGSTFDITSGGTQDLVVMDDFLYDEPKTLN
jgi:hypothetical protein